MTLEVQQKAKSNLQYTTRAKGWLKLAHNHNLKRVFYSMLNAGNHLASLLGDQKFCKSGHGYPGSVVGAEVKS